MASLETGAFSTFVSTVPLVIAAAPSTMSFGILLNTAWISLHLKWLKSA